MNANRHLLLFTLCLTLADGLPASAFCGFYVGKADTKLFNEASKVVLVRDDDKTVLTMANDYRGELTEFALVVPVPTFITEEQIHVTEQAVIDHLDAYTAPRLVEYFDEDPCFPRREEMMGSFDEEQGPSTTRPRIERAKALGVTIEAEYTVGEYDILILSAKESSGLETWLRENGYRIPEGASRVLETYIKQKMRFFVAKVNLEEQGKRGATYLRPIQVAYESKKFMLPIRLGTVNADGPQELFIMLLTRQGRVECTNYRTVKIPTGDDIPVYIKDQFADFYRAMFAEQVDREAMKAVFLEYAWDMNWCDPCAAEPLSPNELRELGAFWIDASSSPKPRRSLGGRQAREAYVTRLHVRYDAESFPDDLRFQVTGNRENFQGRYVLRHPFTGKVNCEAGRQYVASLSQRFEREAQTLASLTGWDIQEIRANMNLGMPTSDEGADDDPGAPWYKKLWQ